MDESTATHPAQLGAPRTHVHVVPTSGFEIVIVKWFNRIRGFGFLTRGEGTEDIFVHHTAIKMDGFRTLTPGEAVDFEIKKDEKGLKAVNVTRAAGAPAPEV